MATSELTVWSGDGKPNWSDAVVAAFATLWAVSSFSLVETVLWVWLAVGFVVGTVAMGPIATSPTGKRIGARFETIGMLGRAVFIVVSLAVLGAVQVVLEVPQIPVTNVAIGGMFALGVVVVAEALRARVPG
jgi:hypothetical protein